MDITFNGIKENEGIYFSHYWLKLHVIIQIRKNLKIYKVKKYLKLNFLTKTLFCKRLKTMKNNIFKNIYTSWNNEYSMIKESHCIICRICN